MTASVENELKKTNENLQAMLNMQKMIIDVLIPKAKPTKGEIKALEEEGEFVSLEDLKKDLEED